MGNTPSQVESSRQAFPSPQHEKMDMLSRPDSRLSTSSMAGHDKIPQHSIQDECLSRSSSQTEVESSGKKRKTTAGDLVKDLETEQDLVKDIETQEEEQEAIVGGCNLDNLLTGDVGELELDDDELLGKKTLF